LFNKQKYSFYQYQNQAEVLIFLIIIFVTVELQILTNQVNTMKKRFVLLYPALIVLFISMAATLKGQRFEIIPFAGYQTSARINAYEGYFRVNDGINYGASANFGANQGYKIELSYGRMGSSLTYTLIFPSGVLCR